LQVHLSERDLALARLYIELLHRPVDNRQPAARLCVGLATPSSEMQRVAVVLHEQLSRLQLTAPVQEITLCVPRLLAAQGESQDLLSGATSTVDAVANALRAIIERLQARWQSSCALPATARRLSTERAQSFARWFGIDGQTCASCNLLVRSYIYPSH
jgi:hypothetical protein